MNEETNKNISYQCSECGFWYKDEEWAKKCEDWCRKYKSCNLEIIRHAIKNSEKE